MGSPPFSQSEQVRNFFKKENPGLDSPKDSARIPVGGIAIPLVPYSLNNAPVNCIQNVNPCQKIEIILCANNFPLFSNKKPPLPEAPHKCLLLRKLYLSTIAKPRPAPPNAAEPYIIPGPI